MEFRKADKNDVNGVLQLQAQNLITNIPKRELSNGFVTTPFNESQIETLVKEDGLFVTSSEKKILAYAIAANWTFFEQWPIFPFMTARFENSEYTDWGINTVNSFQYGPVCIDAKWRGKGLIYSLFETLRLELVKKYPLSATFINKQNQRSFAAHTRKLGWFPVDEFGFNGNEYYTLLYDMKKSISASEQ